MKALRHHLVAGHNVPPKPPRKYEKKVTLPVLGDKQKALCNRYDWMPSGLMASLKL